MEVVAIWIGFAVLAAIAARQRGRSASNWFLLGILFSLFALLAVLLLPKLGTPTSSHMPEGVSWKTHALCPDCKEYIRKGANVCKHCGKRLFTPDESQE